MTTPITIAIDGPSASGKGTLARRLARHFDLAYLDTGLLYRAVGLKLLRAGGDPTQVEAAAKAAQTLDPASLAALSEDPALRDEAASVAASQVAAIPAVRAALLKFQQDFCAAPPDGKKGAVLDGRDIGTVIAPAAPVKIFVTADTTARAARRYKELRQRGEDVKESAVLADLQARDKRDAERAIAPTKPAPDAVLLDTTSLTADAAFDAALAIVRTKLPTLR